MTIGPRTLKTLENGPKREYMGGGHCTWTESHRDFARRVALIAVEEERERCAQVAVEAQRFCTDHCDSAAAAIWEGR